MSIAEAERQLKLTTISYPEWKRRVDRSYYKDVKTTAWWKAFHELELAKAEPAKRLAAAGTTYLFGDS